MRLLQRERRSRVTTSMHERMNDCPSAPTSIAAIISANGGIPQPDMDTRHEYPPRTSADSLPLSLSARGKVHAIPDNSDKSEFGTKRICHACFVELEKEAKKKKDLADGKEPED